jgi:hypothetical protein
MRAMAVDTTIAVIPAGRFRFSTLCSLLRENSSWSWSTYLIDALSWSWSTYFIDAFTCL